MDGVNFIGRFRRDMDEDMACARWRLRSNRAEQLAPRLIHTYRRAGRQGTIPRNCLVCSKLPWRWNEMLCFLCCCLLRILRFCPKTRKPGP